MIAQSNFSKSLVVVSTTFTGAIVLGTGWALPVRASSTLDRNATLPKRWSVSVEFQSPGNNAPATSIGGSVRGSVQFAAPGEAAPRTSVSAGVRGDVQFDPPGEAAPRTSVAAGVRGDEFPALTALVPPTQHGQTLSARPTFYVYVPPTASRQVFFSIQDEGGNPLYHTTLNISGEGGTIGVKLPDSAPALEMETHYLWAFAPIEPNGILRPDNFSVVGWVKRVAASVSTEETSSPVELATAYGASGIWYETLEVLANAQLDLPGDDALASEWKDLLKQVGLESVATQPILK